MSSSNTSATIAEVNAINSSTIIFVNFWSFLLFAFGAVGHLLSMYVFTRPSLRSNPCSRYFLASTISGSCVVYLNVPLRLLQTGYNTNLFAYSFTSCKILTFILFWARAQTPWIIVLSSIDRFLCSSSSATIRAWSNLRVASRNILLIILLVGLAYFHVLIYYQINLRQNICVAQQGFYQIFIGIWNMVVFSLGPSIVMLIFGSLTIRHTRQMVRRIVPDNTQTQPQPQPQQRRKIKDRQLIQMMLVQCAVFSFTATPISINYLYTAARTNIVTDSVQTAKDNMFNQITGLVSITGPCISFYMFTLSSQLFRHELMTLFNGRRRPNQENAMNSISLARRN